MLCESLKLLYHDHYFRTELFRIHYLFADSLRIDCRSPTFTSLSIAKINFHDFLFSSTIYFAVTSYFPVLLLIGILFRQLYKSCVDDRQSDYLTLERYVAKRISVDFNEAFPLSADQWTLSNILAEIREAGTNLGLTRVHEEVDTTWNR